MKYGDRKQDVDTKEITARLTLKGKKCCWKGMRCKCLIFDSKRQQRLFVVANDEVE
jgi:hypothetical protein